MQELGIDYMTIAKELQEEYEAKKAKERAYKQQQKIEELKHSEIEIENVDVADFDYDDDIDTTTYEEVEGPIHQNTTTLFEKERETELDEMEEAARIAKEKRKEKTAADIKEYTSKFENFADASNKSEQVVSKPKKKVEEAHIETKDEQKEEELQKKKAMFEQMKPIYSEEELAEIEEAEYEEENAWDDDVDYEEYDEYYD